MLVNYDSSYENENLLEESKGDDFVVYFYRCCNTTPFIPESQADVVCFSVVEEKIKDEAFIDAKFSSFIEAKTYYDYLCRNHTKAKSIS